MDFFKSVFSADPEPPNPRREEEEEEDDDPPHAERQPPQDPDRGASAPAPAAAWGFGGLVKTLASRSESVLQTYRRDIEEFGSGLRKETAAFREVATRVVRDLPTSLDAGASAAQESLENVGQALDEFGGTVWRGTAGVISQGKDALLAVDPDAGDPHNPGSAKSHSRFEVRLVGMQGDPATFLEDPEDKQDFVRWKDGFRLSDEAIDDLCADSVVLRGMFDKLVPRDVDYDAFWTRYFYKVFKHKQAEDARAMLVKRVIAGEQSDEDLSWEVDDDEEQEQRGGAKQKEVVAPPDEEAGTKKEENTVSGSQMNATEATAMATTITTTDREIEPTKEVKPIDETATLVIGPVQEEKPIEMSSQVETVKPEAVVRQSESVQKTVPLPPDLKVVVDPRSTKTDDKTQLGGKAESAGSCKDSDISVVSSQPSLQGEDDLGWDEIEDVGEDEEKKPPASIVGANKDDLRKRLSVAEDDEDLSWDIEDN